MTALDGDDAGSSDDTSSRLVPQRTAPTTGSARWQAMGAVIARRRILRGSIPAVVLTLVAGGTASAVTLLSFAGPSQEQPDIVATVDAVEQETAAGVDPPQGDSDPTELEAAAAGLLGLSDEGLSDEESSPPGEDMSTEDDTLELAIDVTFAEVVAIHGLPDYAAILGRKFPGAQWSLNGNDPEQGLSWFGPGTRPTRSELDDLWAVVAADLAAERELAERAAAIAAQQRADELEARRNDPTTQDLLDSFDPRTIWGTEPDYAAILSRRFPGAQWSLNGNDPDGGLTWHESSSRPSKAELDAMWADVAREMALELDPVELSRWAGTGDEIYVDGVLRPKGWIGGADDPQPSPVATPENLQYLPQLPHTNGGSPVGTIEVLRDPTGSKNFEQLYGVQLHELGALIAQAHGYFGGSYGLGLSLNGDRELMWYSDQVDPQIVADVLASLGALPEPEPGTPDEGNAQD
jgi:hypothetical protein